MYHLSANAWGEAKGRLAPWMLNGFFPDIGPTSRPFGGAASVLLRNLRSMADRYRNLISDA